MPDAGRDAELIVYLEADIGVGRQAVVFLMKEEVAAGRAGARRRRGAAVELRVVLEVLSFLLVVEEAEHVVDATSLARGLQFHGLLIGRADLGERQEVVVEAVV